MLVFIDGPMITKFVEDTEAFNKCADERFKMLDLDGDGLLTSEDLPRGGALGKALLAMDMESHADEDIKKTYDSIFNQFNVGSNSLDLQNFRSMVAEIMLAIARGIGNNPMNILLDDDSLLLNACAQRN